MFKKVFFCPVNGWDCPYYKENRTCALVDEGEDPTMECDDVGSFFDEDDDPYVYMDENGKVYDNAEELLLQGYHIVNDEVVSPPDDEVVKPKAVVYLLVFYEWEEEPRIIKVFLDEKKAERELEKMRLLADEFPEAVCGEYRLIEHEITE